MDYEKEYKEALERAKAGKPMDEVFPELNESEDERITSEIVDFISRNAERGDDIMKSEGWIAYLERQKEHQNNSDAPNESSWTGIISSSDKDSNLDELAQEYIDGVKQYHSTPTWDLMQTAVCYGYHLREEVGSEGVESVKPEEWSEEDENKIESIKGLITTGKFVDTNTIRAIWKLLDSLRPQPHWKPSKEQTKALNEVANDGVLLDLFNDLLKLL